MAKSADAFRTISEVAEWLELPTHVLRFWESKFSQIKPVKRAGGRRYYRPRDMQLIGGLKKLLHDDGMTIRGAQKQLKEHGVLPNFSSWISGYFLTLECAQKLYLKDYIDNIISIDSYISLALGFLNVENLCN